MVQTVLGRSVVAVHCQGHRNSCLDAEADPSGSNESRLSSCSTLMRRSMFLLSRIEQVPQAPVEQRIVIPWTKNHKDPDTIDLHAPRHAHDMHKAWKRHQNAVYWVDINLALKKGLKFYQTRSNAIILHEALPAYCIPKVVRMETGEVLYEKVYMSPRPPPKISLKHDWKGELGSEVAE